MALISEESLERSSMRWDKLRRGDLGPTPTCAPQGAPSWSGSWVPSTRSARRLFSFDARKISTTCFGCGVGGDTINVRVEEKRVGLRRGGEAAADRYWVELQAIKEDPRARRGGSSGAAWATFSNARRASLQRTDLWDSAEGWQGARLPGRARGGSKRGAAGLRVGYAPSGLGRSCCCVGSLRGSLVESCRAVGLAQSGDSGGEYETASAKRIMFGRCRDRRGPTPRPLRRAGDGAPYQGAKYVNTAETDFFHKSHML